MSAKDQASYSAEDDLAKELAKDVISELRGEGILMGGLLRTPPSKTRLAANFMPPPAGSQSDPLTTTTGAMMQPPLPPILEEDETKGEKSKRPQAGAGDASATGGQYSYAPPPRNPNLADVMSLAMAEVHGQHGIITMTTSASTVGEPTKKVIQSLPKTVVSCHQLQKQLFRI